MNLYRHDSTIVHIITFCRDVYWTVFNQYKGRGRIEKSDYAGNHHTVVLEDLKNPRSLTIDYMGKFSISTCSVDYDWDIAN